MLNESIKFAAVLHSSLTFLRSNALRLSFLTVEDHFTPETFLLLSEFISLLDECFVTLLKINLILLIFALCTFFKVEAKISRNLPESILAHPDLGIIVASLAVLCQVE